MTIEFDDPVQREIWATIRALNDAWTCGDPDDLAEHFHRDMIAITPTDRLRREGRAACITGWKDFARNTRIGRWTETDPVIRVFGDAAVVAYYYDIAYETDGRTVETSGRDMFFMVREDGRWWAVADQFSGYPGWRDG